jgi:hypothetical protein
MLHALPHLLTIRHFCSGAEWIDSAGQCINSKHSQRTQPGQLQLSLLYCKHMYNMPAVRGWLQVAVIYALKPCCSTTCCHLLHHELQLMQACAPQFILVQYRDASAYRRHACPTAAVLRCQICGEQLSIRNWTCILRHVVAEIPHGSASLAQWRVSRQSLCCYRKCCTCP